MKKLLATLLFIIAAVPVMAQEVKEKPYNEEINAMTQIDEAVAKAKQEGKFVICQVGGNWCPWCLRFNEFIHADEEISKLIADNFVYIHVNYSPKNKNEEAMKRLGNCTRFGFPVMVVLCMEGNVKHIQDSGYLEEGKGYNKEKVLKFFKNWTPAAVHGK